MAVVIDGTTGISTPAEAVAGNLSYTGTLTGGAGVINLGSGQVYKDASGNVGIGTSSPARKLTVEASENRVVSVKNSGTYAFATFSDGTTSDDGQVRIGAIGNNLLAFAGGSERARIDASGNLLVGATATQNGNRLYVQSSNFVVGINGTNTTGEAVRFYSNGSTAGTISYSATSVGYNTSSDYRLKDTIAPMQGALARVAALKPVTYKWKVDGSDGEGFIAHELQAVVPDCVTGEKDAVDADGNPQYQGIDTSFLVATLTAAIQEQQTLITALTAQTSALAERLTALEGAAA